MNDRIVTEDKRYVRDPHSKALLVTDHKEADEYRVKKSMLQKTREVEEKQKRIEERQEKLEQKVDQVLNSLDEIIRKLNKE